MASGKAAVPAGEEAQPRARELAKYAGAGFRG
jgi:hypothetical protein